MRYPPVHKFTFIIPAYEAKDSPCFSFARCLDSLAAQTCKDFNVIVVMDGHNPVIQRICDTWQWGMTTYSLPHRGIPGGPHCADFALQTPECCGEFVCILNGDNILRPTYVEEMYNENADVLLCMVLNRDMDMLVTSGLSLTKGRIDRLNYAIRTSYAKQGRHTVRREQDWDFLQSVLEVIPDARFHHIEKILGEHN